MNYQIETTIVECSALRNVAMISTGFDNPIYILSDHFIASAKLGWNQHENSKLLYCYVERPLLALPEWSTCHHSHWYRVRYADNGIDRGYRNHVCAHSPNDAKRMVLRNGEWDGHDNREILSVECFEYPEMEFETNSYRGLDVGSYGDY